MSRVPPAPESRANGHLSNFAEIVRAHQAMVFSMAYHFLHDRALAEELAQEVFLQLYQNQIALQSADHLVSWLRRVTIHRCIDQARRRKLRPEVGLDGVAEPSVLSPMPDPWLADKLRRLVASLPGKPRMIIILRYQEDLDPAEIADLLKMPVNTVKSHLQRALALLRDKLSFKEK